MYKKLSLLFFFFFFLASCAHNVEKSEQIVEEEILPMVEENKKLLLCPDVSCFRERQIEKGILTAFDLDYFFANVEFKQDIINIMNRPGTSYPWYVFKKNHVSDLIIKRGVEFYRENSSVLSTVSNQYGIPPEYIIAIIGVETNFGRVMGRNRVADALYTLAFNYPRRAELFQNELESLLLLSKELNKDPFSYLGSFAGAMGYPQFMPSSYRKWAVSYSGSNIADIWSNKADAIASVANYLVEHGWERGGQVLIPVHLDLNDELSVIIDEKTSLKYTIKELREKGVVLKSTVHDDEYAILFRLEVAQDQYNYFIGLNNFYTIWGYNNSKMYVTAIEMIADAIRKKL